jgi:hypothetical protein
MFEVTAEEGGNRGHTLPNWERVESYQTTRLVA